MYIQYITDDILLYILELLNYKEKIFLIICFKEFYNKYDHILKKYKIHYHLNNNNYVQFYNLLDTFDYNKNEVLNLMVKSLKVMKIINRYKKRILRISSFYDMRFIFELLYKYEYRLDESTVKNENIHFHLHFYNQLLSCIYHNDRSKTKKKINNNKMLISLHSSFKGIYNTNIIEDIM